MEEHQQARADSAANYGGDAGTHADEAANHAGEAAGHARDAAAQAARDMGREAQDRIDEFRRTAQGYAEQGREQFEDAQAQLEAFVREKPLIAVLIAAAIGFIIGAIFKRD